MAKPDWQEGVTLVTGAGSGIGAAVARALVAAGSKVAAIDCAAGGLTELLREHANDIASFQLDVSDAEALQSAVSQVERAFGPIHGLVNAAGVLPLGKLCSDELDESSFRRAFAVNVEGVWQVTRAVARPMIARRRGAIVTVASNAGSTPRSGMGAYCASKAAASMLTRAFGLELAEYGVRCNVVSPGSTDTPMLRALLGAAGDEQLIAGNPSTFRLGIPLGRLARASDVAEAVLFLLSERARHITLQDLRVDGGATL